jgi:SPP1 gp7 family putative phage head morphogenesis protein
LGKFNLNTADGIRVELTKQQQKEIEDLYRRVAKNIAKEAEKIPRTTSDAMRQQYLKKLQKQVDDQLEKLGEEIQGTITHNMALTAQAMVSANQQVLGSVGLYVQGAFSRVPDDVVRSVATGQLYKGDWSLSKAIWGNTKKTQKDINTIIAEGIAQNKSAYAIAKDLEKYVNPSAKKDWDWAKVYPGTSKKVDYNAQRLARTAVSHAYQQSFIRTTQKNPFVTKYKWLGSNSHRICPICAERDGKLFEKDELPLDHPNGMCTFVAVMDESMVDMADRIADWALGKPDPELDDYADYLRNS